MSGEYSSEDLTRLSFHDSELHSIGWENAGEDLALLLTWYPPKDSTISCPGEPTESRLCGRSVTDLVIDLQYGDFVGTPSIYQLNVARLPTGRWKVIVDFIASPDGIISFECDDVSLQLGVR